jgi:hypothetical protein
MSDEEFVFAYRQLQEYVSMAICAKLDSMEDDIQSTKSVASDIINRF